MALRHRVGYDRAPCAVFDAFVQEFLDSYRRRSKCALGLTSLCTGAAIVIQRFDSPLSTQR